MNHLEIREVIVGALLESYCKKNWPQWVILVRLCPLWLFHSLRTGKWHISTRWCLSSLDKFVYTSKM